MINHCPNCGKTNIEDHGSVFIEAGPYNGKCYADEGDYCRYRCTDCKFVFGEMPAQRLCSCGEPACGEVGSDCEEDPDRDGEFLCEVCMKKLEEKEAEE